MRLSASNLRVASAFGLLVVFAMAACVVADENERPPIEYSKREPANCVSRLQSRLSQGELQLEYDEERGYLASLLKALHVPVESQMLVYSKTSLQRDHISPRTPRAVYFSDDVYVGFCQGGDVLEVSAVDPQLGAVFYTLDQQEADEPRLRRQTDNCLTCHSSSRTDGVPGHLVRSLFVDPAGQTILSSGSFAVDHTTPLHQRWGGWYVTGTHGTQTHLGNLVVRGKELATTTTNAAGQNVTRLDDRLNVDKYLTPHSDIVALMVLEHQTLVHNRLTKANFAARQALWNQQEMNRAFGDPEDKPLESTARRIQGAGDDLVEALLLVDEAKLTAQISGISGFAEKFASRGQRDRQGRSLRDFDLQQRLFKYPCSYLIYSAAFDGLPPAMKDYVWKRLWDVLTSEAPTKPFDHLSKTDRLAIIDIIRATKDDLPTCWTATGSR